LHEVRVREEGLEEPAEPDTSYGDRGVVTIRCHIWGDEEPLRKFVLFELLLEDSGVLDLGKSILYVGDRVVQNTRAVDLSIWEGYLLSNLTYLCLRT
jgi:hypothetical protein